LILIHWIELKINIKNTNSRSELRWSGEVLHLFAVMSCNCR